MSNISAKVHPYFESLPIELKNEILKQDVQLNTLADLIQCLETIAEEG